MTENRPKLLKYQASYLHCQLPSVSALSVFIAENSTIVIDSARDGQPGKSPCLKVQGYRISTLTQ